MFYPYTRSSAATTAGRRPTSPAVTRVAVGFIALLLLLSACDSGSVDSEDAAPNATETSATETSTAEATDVTALDVEPVILERTNLRRCSDVPDAQSNWLEIKVDPAAAGTHTGPDGSTVEIALADGGKTISWTFSGVKSDGVDVFVNKAGPNSRVFNYRPNEAVEDSDTAPHGSSHVLFCYDPDPEARINIQPHGVNEVGDAHRITALVEVDEERDGSYEPFEGALVQFSTDFGTFAPANGQCTTIADGTCYVDLNSNDVGTSTVNASTTITVIGSTLTRTTDGLKGNSGPVTKQWVDAFIAVTPEEDENGSGEQHRFEVAFTALPNDAGSYAFGAIAYSFSPSDPESISSNCGSPVVSGNVASCYIDINHSSAATFEVSASGSVEVGYAIGGSPYSATVSRATDGSTTPSGAVNSGPATKTYVDGSLSWLKHDDASNLLNGASFSVQRTLDRFGNAVTLPSIAVTDNSSPDLDVDGGEFLLDGLPLGTYEIRETAAPPGYVFDPTYTQTVVLSLENPDGSAALPFVNVPDEFEGCTPGYWRQEHHFDSWVTYSPGDDFDTVFGVDAFAPDITLLDAVDNPQTYGTFYFHAVAALLNAASGVNYTYSELEVISMVQAAVASGELEATKNLFAAANEAGCPLN